MRTVRLKFDCFNSECISVSIVVSSYNQCLNSGETRGNEGGTRGNEGGTKGNAAPVQKLQSHL